MSETAVVDLGPTKSRRMQLVERRFGARIEDLLSTWTDEGLSPEKMAERITGAGIPICGMAVRGWIKNLGGQRQRRLVFPRKTTAVS